MSGSIEHVTQPIRSSGSNRKSQLTMHIVLDRGRPVTTKKGGRTVCKNFCAEYPATLVHLIYMCREALKIEV